jgi:hypothetical protein
VNRTADAATLWIPGPLPGLNEIIDSAKGSGGRGAGYARLKRQWTDTIWALAKSARIDTPGPFEERVTIAWLWVERDQRRDPDNFIAGGRKVVLDGLVKAGVLRGDTWKWIGRWTDEWTVDALRPGVRLDIRAEGAAR